MASDLEVKNHNTIHIIKDRIVEVSQREAVRRFGIYF